jgi:hypothetical protein
MPLLPLELAPCSAASCLHHSRSARPPTSALPRNHHILCSLHSTHTGNVHDSPNWRHLHLRLDSFGSHQVEMSASIRPPKMADLEEEQLKLRLEQYRSSNKPKKSILKLSGNNAVVACASKKVACSGADGSAHPLLSITPKFRSSHSDASKPRSRPSEPGATAAEHHLHIILQKVMTDVNSLVNTGKIEQVQ